MVGVSLSRKGCKALVKLIRLAGSRFGPLPSFRRGKLTYELFMPPFCLKPGEGNAPPVFGVEGICAAAAAAASNCLACCLEEFFLFLLFRTFMAKSEADRYQCDKNQDKTNGTKDYGMIWNVHA